MTNQTLDMQRLQRGPGSRPAYTSCANPWALQEKRAGVRGTQITSQGHRQKGWGKAIGTGWGGEGGLAVVVMAGVGIVRGDSASSRTPPV